MFGSTRSVNAQKITSKRKLSAFVALIIIATSAITYTVTTVTQKPAVRVPNTTLTQGPTIYLAPSYTMWREGDVYYYEDGNDTVIGSGRVPDTLASDMIYHAGLVHGSVFFKSAYYDLLAPITVNVSVSIYGEHVADDGQADRTNHLYGTVFRTARAITVFDVEGPIGNLVMEHFGIEFTGVNTGNGIQIQNPSSPSAHSYAVVNGEFEDIAVLNNDASHYAFYISNFQHLDCRLLRSWGGPFLYLFSNDYGVQYGNSVFEECYGMINRPIQNHAVQICASGNSSGNFTNLIQFTRLQLNFFAPPTGTDWNSYKAALYLSSAEYISFQNLDIEDLETSKHLVKVVSMVDNCRSIIFYNPYFYCEASGSKIRAEGDCYPITFYDGVFVLKEIELTANYINVLYSPFLYSTKVDAPTIVVQR